MEYTTVIHILGDVLVFLVTITFLVILYYKWSYSYWDRKGIPNAKPKFPYGNLRSFANIKEPEYLAIYRCYRELKERGQMHGGIYAMTKPIYFPVDAEIVKNILIADFDHFCDRAVYFNEKYDPLSAHLLSLDGKRWRTLRTKLTPAFTSGKMKMMFQTMLDCSYQLSDALEKMSFKDEPIDIKEFMARYTTDVIGSCAFGVECNSFKDPESEFRRYGSKVSYVTKLRHFQRFLAASFPDFSRAIGIPTIPKDVSRFFMGLIRNVVDRRRELGIKRNDVLQILTELNRESNNKQNSYPRDIGGAVNGLKQTELAKRPLTMNEIASNSFIFFIAGFETAANTMSFCFYELSRHQRIQDRIRDEIKHVLVKYEGKITYESLFEMQYLRQVLDETLRKYPIIPTMKRKCTENYKIPGTQTIIEKGTAVYISVYGLQRDPDYFPEPEKFDPERFSDENKGNIKAGTYLGFGEGPRICIGKRFGLMQMMIGVVGVLQEHRLKLSSKMASPLEFEPNAFIVMPKGTIWMELEKI